MLDNIYKHYCSHKGNLKTRIWNMQNSFEELMNVYDSADIRQKVNKEVLFRKNMGLTMEYIKAYIFIIVHTAVRHLLSDGVKKMREEALAQIETMQSEQELCEEGYQEMLKYGVCFYKKGCIVKNALIC